PSGLAVPKAAVLIGQTVGHDAEHTAHQITQLCEHHGAVEVTVAQDDTLLEARRLANPALSARGLRVSCDVGVPIGELANVFRGIDEIAAKHNRAISIVAHAAAGNLHPTVEAGDTGAEYAAAEAVIVDISRLAVWLGGTISGDDGTGAVKHHELRIQLVAAVVATQRAIKQALDPNRILARKRHI